jgi:hypothetical protein
MSNEFAHDVAMEWAKANSTDLSLSPAEFGVRAAQVYLAADMAFANLPGDVPRITERLAALSVPSETLQSLLRCASQSPGLPGRVPETQADAEGPV